MNYIHGHRCIHNLIDYENRFNYLHVNYEDVKNYWHNPYDLLKHSKTSCVYAVHPFTNSSSANKGDYARICEDFGYTLERVEHPWNSLDSEALWEIAKQFSWSQQISEGNGDDILNPEFIYMGWHKTLFRFTHSKDDWYDLIGIGPK